MKKVYFPREVLPIAIVLSNLVNFLISLPVLLILMFISGVPITSKVLLLPIPIFIELIFATGMVLFLSALEVFYRDTHMLMDVGMQAWFFLTPILYNYRDLPEDGNAAGRDVRSAGLVVPIESDGVDHQHVSGHPLSRRTDGVRFSLAHCGDGDHRVGLWLLVLPAFQRTVRRDGVGFEVGGDSVNPVLDWLYVGPVQDAEKYDLLKREGIQAVLSLAWPISHPDIEVAYVPFDDGASLYDFCRRQLFTLSRAFHGVGEQ